ncbi:hypothetical protein G6F57_016217 [Rhizopus arrhizus]|nr:hypothetical protein G6F57_016217 [Rhizopus arrhizus]
MAAYGAAGGDEAAGTHAAGAREAGGGHDGPPPGATGPRRPGHRGGPLGARASRPGDPLRGALPGTHSSGGAPAPSALLYRAAQLAGPAVLPVDPVAQGHAHPQRGGRRVGGRRAGAAAGPCGVELGDDQPDADQQQRHDRRGLAPRGAAVFADAGDADHSGALVRFRLGGDVLARRRLQAAGGAGSDGSLAQYGGGTCAGRDEAVMPSSDAGLNALIAQCRRVEAALAGSPDPSASVAMHRFVADMDARRIPPGMWSPLALSVLVMTGGLGVGIEVLSLVLRAVGSAWAAFALVAVCAGTALAFGWRSGW